MFASRFARNTGLIASAVLLVFLAGCPPSKVTVPDVSGMTQEAAETAITSASLAIGTVTQQYSATIPAGNVISQDPAAGASVTPGSEVDVCVSSGPEAPQAAFGVNIQSGMAPLEVQFSDLSAPGASAITVWFWDFGDGFTSNEANPTYIYKTPGTYTVSLTVTTDAGADTVSMADEIAVAANTADSDVDGVPDVQEAALGSDPNNNLDGGGQLPSSDPHQTAVTGGDVPVTVDQATYSVLTERLTGVLPGTPDAYALVGGLDAYEKSLSKSANAVLKDYQADKDGMVGLDLNADATALLQLKDMQGNLLMYAYFPKHADLRTTSPNLDYLDCAAALVYTQPLLVNDDAVYTAVMLQIIKQLPETRTLADLLKAKAATKPDIMADPDEEVMRTVSYCVSALMTLAEQRSKHLRKAMKSGEIPERIMKLLPADKSDTNNATFHDLDGRDGDKVDVEASFSNRTGTFALTNHLTRWVTCYVDQNSGGIPQFNGQYAGIIEPRSFEIPAIKDLVLDALVYNIGGVIWDIFSGDTEQLLQSAIERAIAAVTTHFAESHRQFVANMLWDDATLSTYTIGRNTGMDDQGRCLAPGMLTMTTEVLLPFISLAIDIDSDVVFDKNKVIQNFTSTISLLENLGGNYGPQLADIMVQAGAGTLSLWDATIDSLDIAVEMGLDPVLWAYLARHGPLGPDLLSHATSAVFESILKKLFAVDTFVDAANLGIAAYNFIDIIVAEDQMDVYGISLAAPVLSVTPPQQDVTAAAGSTTFTVSNTGTGTMVWTASVTSGGSWLRITSGASGTNNSPTINVSYDAYAETNLRTGIIQVTAPGASGSPKTVLVVQAGTLTQPVLSVTPQQQEVPTAAGSTTFHVSNAGMGTMAWTASLSSGGSWLWLTSGSSGTNNGTINVGYDANSTLISRTGTIQVTAAGASGSPKIVSVVQAAALPQPVLFVTPQQQDVTSAAGSTSFSVSNTGTGTMEWTASVTSGGSWLRITSGANGTNNSPTINVSYDENQAISSRTGTILVTASGALGSPKTVSVVQKGTAGTEETLLLPGGVQLVMVWIPGGTFMMGRYPGEQDSSEDEDPRHQVTVPGFWMAKYELTKRQWQAVMGTTPWSWRGDVLDDLDSPAVFVSWNDAKAFITALNTHTGLTFRLPSEAEWEYACRADTTTRFYWGDDPESTQIGNYAWCWLNYSGEWYAHVVGLKLPNAFGLQDMSGNVWEWCEDDWHSSYTGAPTDGSAWVDSPRGLYRMYRGGSWNCIGGLYYRSAIRNYIQPSFTQCFLGFRLAR